ncbi:MAG: PASTA domain-containing protein [Bacteroidaceae bacterium]|nr:PASTA domain-containing protein [Bacteroidaceae bacterium]
MANKHVLDKSGLKFIGGNIVLAVIIGILLLVVLILQLRGYTQHGKEIEVADVTGMYLAEAETTLQGQGLRIQVIDSTYSRKVPFGTIVEQTPKGSSHAKEGRIVYVTINASGKPQVVMPDLQDMSYRQAETTLRSIGLVVDSIYDYEPSAYRDLVLDVKAEGESIQPGQKIAMGTKVRLVVGFGRGTEQVEVPNVIGMSPVDARRVLLSHRLTVGAVTCDEAVEEDGAPLFVYRQIPAAGEKLIEGETVALKLTMDIEKAVTGGGPVNHTEDEWF